MTLDNPTLFPLQNNEGIFVSFTYDTILRGVYKLKI